MVKNQSVVRKAICLGCCIAALFAFLYSFLNFNFLIKFPFQYTEKGIPYTEISIGDQKYDAWVDLGRNSSQFRQDISFAGLIETGNDLHIQGLNQKIVKVKEVEISSLKIDCHEFKKIRGVLGPISSASYKLTKEGETQEILRPYPPVVLGNDVFEKGIFLIDYPNNQFWYGSQQDVFINEGVQIHDWIKIPFNYDLGIVWFEAEFEGQKEGWILDTGCTWNFIYTEKKEEGVSFKDLENQKILMGENLIFLTDCLSVTGFLRQGIRGILGAPFFEQHRVAIDFVSQTVFIEQTEEVNLSS